MKPEEFKSQFKKLVWIKSEIASYRKHLSRLHAWDKNGSHDKAILKALEKRDELKQKFEEMLRGKTYEEWQAFSKKLVNEQAKLKRARASFVRAGEKLTEVNESWSKLEFDTKEKVE